MTLAESVLTFEEIIKGIVRVENDFAVNSLQYGEIKIWPIIRRAIAMEASLSGVTENISKRQLLNFFSEQIQEYLRNAYCILFFLFSFRNYPKNLNKLKKLGPVDFLFFSRLDDYSDKISGKYLNRYIDPLISFTKGKYSYLKVEIVSKQGIQQTRYEKTNFIDPKKFYRLATIKSKIFRRKDSISGFVDVNNAIKKYLGKMNLGYKWIVHQAHTVEWQTIFYKDILKAIRPKAVFLVYYPGSMALIRACRQLGIKTIDIQHGQQGKYSRIYTNWTKIPKRGYELLPDFFWIWGKKSKENIKTMNANSRLIHQPIIGGYRMIPFWKNNMVGSLDKEETKKLHTLKRFKRVILMCCQPIPDYLPSHVIEAMKRSPNEWIWMIRLHPRQQITIDEVTEHLKSIGLNNFDVKFPSSIPLYDIINHSTHQLTCWSSVCQETLAFGVPSAILHPIGFNNLEEYINEGLFAYTPNEASLMKFIEEVTFERINKPDNPYIETSDKYAETAFKTIIESKS